MKNWEEIRSDVEKAINAKKCADFLKTLLDEAAVQTGEPYRDLMVTFDNTQFSYGGTQGFCGLAPGSFERANLIQFEKNFISADRSGFIRTQIAQNALAEMPPEIFHTQHLTKTPWTSYDELRSVEN